MRVRVLQLGFLIGVVAMLVNVGLPYVLVNSMNESAQATAQSRRLQEALASLLSSLKDAETGERGYVITGVPGFLDPYREAQRRTERLLADLRARARNDRGLGAHLESLEGLIAKLDDQHRKVIDARRDRGFDAAQSLIQSGAGKDVMDSIRGTIARMRERESQRIDSLREEERHSEARFRMALVAITLFNLAVFVAVFYYVFRTLRERESDSAQLKETAARLGAGMQALERRNREISLLSTMASALQSAESEAEAFDVVGRFCAQLFAHKAGSVYRMHPSRDLLEERASWGDPVGRSDDLEPRQCWALRRGQPHEVLSPKGDLVCEHMRAAEEHRVPYVCIPLMANGEVLGLATIERPAANGTPQSAESREEHSLELAVSEQISLSLSNLALRQTLRRHATVDPLTGLYNRRFLDETLVREIARAARRKSSIAFLMADVDFFKRFNDRYGHDAGDAVLRMVAAEMQKQARGSDLACRYGGEEFLLVLHDASLQAAQEKATRLREAVKRQRVTYSGLVLDPVTLSVGVAAFPAHGGDAQTVISSADAALYRAKQEGRDRVEVAADLAA